MPGLSIRQDCQAGRRVVRCRLLFMAKKTRYRPVRQLWRKLREPLVTGLFAVADFLIPRLSRRRVLALARVLGTLGATLDRYGRRVAEANLRLLFGVRMTPWRSRLLVRGSYRRAAAIALDSIWFGRDTAARVGAWTRLDEVRRSGLMTDRPALVVAAHFGNWEMTLLVGGLAGVPLVAVVKEQWSQVITARANRLRSALGVRLVFADGALRVLLKEMKGGHVAGFVLDQHTSEQKGGVWVDFGGRPAMVSSGVALLARRFHAPVYFGFPYARKDGRYDIHVPPPLRPLPGESDTQLTQRIVNVLLRHIRRHPSQWMLMYPRWSRYPLGDDPARFPFYARVQSPPAAADLPTEPQGGAHV
jgi:KDO2-lipid IV(A) lauroyltransferase